MAEDSSISWTHNTQNFWVGCDKVAPECSKCYIGRILQRHPDKWPESWGGVYRTSDALWNDPWKWEAALSQDLGSIYGLLPPCRGVPRERFPFAHLALSCPVKTSSFPKCSRRLGLFCSMRVAAS